VQTTPLRQAPPLQRTQFSSSKRFGSHRHRSSLRNIEPAIVKKPASLNLFWNSRQRVTARPALLTTIPSCQSAPLPTRFYRPAREGLGKFLGVLLRAAGAERRIYFNDQVTGRLVERSGWVCTNFSRRVYSLPVTALSLVFQ
jgi:hypothetical protein